MTIHNLPNFKNWLNEEPSRKENLQHWEECFSNLYYNLQINGEPENIDNYKSWLQNIKNSGEGNVKRYLMVINKYQLTRERERERERTKYYG